MPSSLPKVYATGRVGTQRCWPWQEPNSWYRTCWRLYSSSKDLIDAPRVLQWQATQSFNQPWWGCCLWCSSSGRSPQWQKCSHKWTIEGLPCAWRRSSFSRNWDCWWSHDEPYRKKHLNSHQEDWDFHHSRRQPARRSNSGLWRRKANVQGQSQTWCIQSWRNCSSSKRHPLDWSYLRHQCWRYP